MTEQLNQPHSSALHVFVQVQLTQDGHHNVIFKDFNGSAGHEVERREYISRMDQRVPGGRMGRLEPHGQSPQAALSCPMKCLTAVEEALVEVEADVGLQALWETLQDLRLQNKS